jgi:hypothetical protein
VTGGNNENGKAKDQPDQHTTSPVLLFTHSLSALKQGFTHPLNGCTSVPSSPNKNETGHPCRFPVVVVRGVLMSACASICRLRSCVSGFAGRDGEEERWKGDR